MKGTPLKYVQGTKEPCKLMRKRDTSNKNPASMPFNSQTKKKTDDHKDSQDEVNDVC